MSKRDLFVVVADLDAENAIKTLLCDRQNALGIQLDFNPDRPPQGDLLRYSGRDSGCVKDAVDVLRAAQRTHQHAILIFDHHGSGADHKSRDTIESELQQELNANGWTDGDAAVIVIEPELEAWVWAASPRVQDVLGWKDERHELRDFLERKGFWDKDAIKPNDPKEAMKAALKQKNMPGGARVFARLASRVGLSQCEDPAFQKFRETLHRWFKSPVN